MDGLDPSTSGWWNISIFSHWSLFQRAIYQDIVDSLAPRQRFFNQAAGHVGSYCSSWCKYRMLLSKPCTSKSQMLIRAVHHACLTARGCSSFGSTGGPASAGILLHLRVRLGMRHSPHRLSYPGERKSELRCELWAEQV